MMRAIILERRPISIITRAIDVLVTSYSYYIRMENAFQGGNISSKRTENPSGQVTTTSNFVSAESSGETMNRRKSVIEVAENGPKQSMTGASDDENASHAEKSGGKGSFNSLSDVDDNANFDGMRIHSGGSLGLQCGSSRTASGVSNLLDTQPTSVAISPDEMFQFVFAPVEEELCADLSYLIAVIVEFLHCCSSMKEKLKVPPDLFAMVIQVLVRSNRHSELAYFVINKILEPSKEVALQLLEQGRRSLKIRKLGMDMLRQLSFHHDYATVLLQEGYYLEALQYARKHKVITLHPSLFLEAAIAAHNLQHLAAVLGFFSDFTPTFKITSEHDRYCTILTDESAIMNPLNYPF